VRLSHALEDTTEELQRDSYNRVRGLAAAIARPFRFDPANGGTRVQIRFFYNPPAGAAGHVVAALLGSDPAKKIEEDLARIKTSIESGTLPHDASARPAPESHV
jgi:uncharacterized membrane protein